MSIPLAPPSGMRDLLPPEAARRARLAKSLTRHFGRWGYALVTTPPFEHAEVIERGLDTLDRRDLLRFVEPDSGEVALLRPDITPQIARIVATRLSERPPPFRLCYAGSLIRQRRGRARRQRQSMQAGVELIGVPSIDADVEAIELAAGSLGAAGLDGFSVELSVVSLARAALAEVPESARAGVEEALIQKDGAELDRQLTRAGVAKAVSRRLRGVAELYGDVNAVLKRARPLFVRPEEKAGLARLGKIVRRLDKRGLGARLSVDLGEVRGASYYTGVSFRLLAPGPGEPVGAGGRYDGLLGRFGMPAPATGFGIDLGHLEWALSAAGAAVQGRTEPRVVVAGGSAARREQIAVRLRRRNVAAAVLDGGKSAALDYARGWEYDAAVLLRGDGAMVVRVDGEQQNLPDKTDRAFVRWVLGHGSKS
ncbi:MAG: ATP phosphoribosyltransferase regulatory subunit [Sandaracinaceae bacterium]